MAATKSFGLEAKFTRRTLSLATLFLAVSACGGGSDGDSPAGTMPPRITVHPADVAAAIGESVMFRVGVESSETVSYQWLRNGAAIAGATGAEYSLATVTDTDTGSQFSVVVRNSAGSVESNKALLSVQPVVDAGNIVLAGGALASLGANHWFVAFAKSGDVFVWERDTNRIVRYNAIGKKIPFAGSLQEFTPERRNMWHPSISVLEHSDGNIYLSFGYLRPSEQINSDQGDGGYIYRVTPDGATSVVYNSDTASTKITPHKLVEGPKSQLYTVHLNTVTLYRLSTAGSLTKVADLSTKPIEQQQVVLRYAPWISMVATQDRMVYISSSLGFDYRISPDESFTPVNYGSKAAEQLAAVGDAVYAYTDNANGNSMVVRRAANGTISVAAGGIRQPVPGESGYGDPVDLGPLPGWLPGFSQVFAAAPDGRIVMGGNSEISGGYSAPYFLLTLPDRGFVRSSQHIR